MIVVPFVGGCSLKPFRLLLLLALMLIPGVLLAQEFTGVVTDPSGAVVPKASIS